MEQIDNGKRSGRQRVSIFSPGGDASCGWSSTTRSSCDPWRKRPHVLHAIYLAQSGRQVLTKTVTRTFFFLSGQAKSRTVVFRNWCRSSVLFESATEAMHKLGLSLYDVSKVLRGVVAKIEERVLLSPSGETKTIQKVEQGTAAGSSNMHRIRQTNSNISISNSCWKISRCFLYQYPICRNR